MRITRMTVGLVSCVLVTAALPFVGCSSDPDPVAVDAGRDLGVADTLPGDASTDPVQEEADPPEPPFDCTQDSAVEAPVNLRCTGLYGAWTKKAIAAGVREFKPGPTLWSDGAVKTRWVLLPTATKIDTTDMEAWVFPVGTKFWKEFAIGGKRVETRMFWKIGSTTWVRTTYQWSADESTALRLDTGYTENDAGDTDAGGYEIPSLAKCDQCHAGAADKILGFEAVGLGVSGATGYTLAQLVSEGRLTVNPAKTALTIPEDGHGSANALGWLHANCGTACHNANPAATCYFKGMHLRLSYAELAAATPVTGLEAYTTTYNVAATLPSAGYKRIAPGVVSNSSIHFLASHRNNVVANGQMPPIDSHLIDPTGVGYLTTWITQLP